MSRDSDEKTFLAALCGLGTLGVVVAVASKAERAFNLEEECWAIGFEDFVDRWQEIAESAEHVRCWWFPQVGQVKVSRLNRTKKASSARNEKLCDIVSLADRCSPRSGADPNTWRTHIVLAGHCPG